MTFRHAGTTVSKRSRRESSAAFFTPGFATSCLRGSVLAWFSVSVLLLPVPAGAGPAAVLPATNLPPGTRIIGGLPVAPTPIVKGGSRTMREVFRRYDRDGNGRLSPAEWGRFARTPATRPLDLDGDGWVTQAEFLQSFLTLRQPRILVVKSSILNPLWRARRLAAGGNWERALLGYRRVIRESPDCAGGYLGMARCLLVLARPAEAARAFRQSLAEEPNEAEAWLGLAVAEDRLHRPKDAAAALERGLALLGDQASIPEGWLRASEEHEHARYLVACLTRMLGRSPTGPPLVARVRSWATSNLPAFRKSTKPDDLAERQAVRAAKAGQFDRALEALNRGLAARPRDGRLLLMRASLLTARRETAKAASDLDRIPAGTVDASILQAVRLGNLLDRGERKKALELAEKLSRQPLDVWQLEEVGWQLAYRAEWATAHAWMERAVATLLDVQRNLLMLALSWMARKDREHARELVGRLSVPPGEEPSLLRVLVRLALETNQTDVAVQATEEAIWQEPRDATNYLMMARVFATRGQRERSEDALQLGFDLAAVGSPRWNNLFCEFVPYWMGIHRPRRYTQAILKTTLFPMGLPFDADISNAATFWNERHGQAGEPPGPGFVEPEALEGVYLEAWQQGLGIASEFIDWGLDCLNPQRPERDEEEDRDESAPPSQGNGQSRHSRESGNPGSASILAPRLRGGDETGLPKSFPGTSPGPCPHPGATPEAARGRATIGR